MALILPSEIARLVFGYLEENECSEAASKFFTTSPHLEECRYVSQKGRKFDTKVNDHTLTDIVEKYFLVMRFVKERLSKMEDSDSQSTDLMVMVKLLLDGSPRGKQRFVVNINVPPPQTGGSPILAGSSRKRRLHSQQHPDRSKRLFRLDPDEEKDKGIVSNQQVNTDATQLNQLPGHSELGQEAALNKSLTDIQSLSTEIKIKETVVEVHKESKLQPMKNSTATDTKELMCYATAEVQTQDYHVESDVELASDMPIENLSLLTREMLSRTEIQEKIAEQINKAGLPNLSSVIKETSFCDNPEVNTSIMSELNNAIKSVVTTTEKDPVFEDFLNEIIGTTDESPDGSPYNSNPTERFNPEVKPEPPNTVEETDIKEEIFNLNEPTHDPLFDDLNAAAIQGIINVNKITRETGDLTEEMKKKENPTTSTAVTLGNETEIPSIPPATVLSIEIPNLPVNINPANLNLVNVNPININPVNVNPVNVNPVNFNPPLLPAVSSSILTTVPKVIQKVPKAIIRKGKPRKAPQPEPTKIKPKIVSNEEVVTTLVFCQQNQEKIAYEEARSMRITSGDTQCLAAMPKVPGETLFLRTVQVPKMIPAPPALSPPPPTPSPPPPPPPSPPLDLAKFRRIAPKLSDLPNLLVEPVEKKKNDQEDEAITLYEHNLESFPICTEIPMMTADELISYSGTGLSPFLKLNKRKNSPEAPGPPAPPVEALPTVDLIGDTSFILEKEESIIKRTPKSLLKSRAKNHRLSLSTPRRRSSHVRALDFNTPTGLSSSRHYSVTSTRPSPSRPLNKSIPRSSLFSTPIKSPRKKAPVKTPVRNLKPLETPIATRSPAPMLQGNWNKVSGVDTIIGCDSQSDNGSPPKKRPKSWDADLREGLVIPEESPKKPLRNPNKSLNNDNEEVNNDPGAPTVKSEVEVESKEAKSSEKVAQSTIVTAKGVTKKYAKLKTITSRISGSSDLSSNFETSATEKVIKDLETPRKSEDIGVPPTPRILSPSSNQCSFVRINSNETKVTGFVTTPEFPVTPCINFTPKHGDNTVDSLKKDFALYYHPGAYGKPVKNVDVKKSNSNVNAAASTSASTSAANTETVVNTSGAKLEITEFEVIKENLPKEETCKELRISNAEGLNKSQESEKSLENSRSDDSDSDSDSSSSSSSSSSSYCSDDQSKSRSRLSVSKISNVLKKSDNLGLDLSDSMIKTDYKSSKDDNKLENCEYKVSQQDGELVRENSGEQEGGLVEKGGETDSGKIQINEEGVCGTIQGEKSVEDLPVEKEKVVKEKEEINEGDLVLEEGEIQEASPKKMFPIIKSDKALEEAEIETPAKNDDLLDEADISETPSGSKNGTETTTTNLTTKISKIINTKSHWQQGDKVMKSTLIDPKNNNDVLPGPGQPENPEVNHEILRRELDEKRLRIMDRLKKNITVKPLYGGSKRKDKNDKAKPRNNVVVKSKAQENKEVKDSARENHEVKDKTFGSLEVKDRNHGNLEMNNRIHENLEIRDRGYGNLELIDRCYENLEVRDRGLRNLEVEDRGHGNFELKNRVYGNLEARDRGYGSLEVRDRGYANNHDPRYRIHGNPYEGNDRSYRSNDPRDRIYGNNYEANERGYKSNDLRDRIYGDHFEGNERGYRSNDPRHKSNETRNRHRSHDGRSRSRGSRGSDERRSKSHGSDEGRGKSHGSNEDRGRNHRSNEDRGRNHRSNEDRGRNHRSTEDRVKSHESNEGKSKSHEDRGKNHKSTDDKGRSRGSNQDRDRRDDKVRNQRTDYDKYKRDDKVRNERLNHEIQPRKEDKVKAKINTVTSEVDGSKDDKIRSQVADDKKDVKEEKSEQVNNKVKGQRTKEAKKEETNTNSDSRREVKLPVIPVTRKSARYAARAAKNEAEKIKCDSSKDKDKKKSVEDDQKSKIEVDKTNLPTTNIFHNILTGKLLLKEVVDRAKLDRDKSNEVSKKDDKATLDKKMKVDAVKRDLFSGDEMSDVETKKVTSSQVEDLMMQLHKSNTPEAPETEELTDKNMVLESLNLQPASKSSSESEADLSMNHCEIKFVHDDNVNSKKRYRKKALDVVPITIPTEDGDTMTVILTLTSHEELFNLLPARVKKITKKDPPKQAPEPVRYRRKVQLKDSKPMVTSIDSQPLATSSPLTMDLPGTSKVVKSELTKPASTNQVQKKKDHGDKINNEAKSKYSDNKLKDPKFLLSKLNQIKIDKLLATVHGPEK